MARAHSISIVHGRSEDGEARFTPRCSCGWSAPRSAGANGAELAEEIGNAHLEQASGAFLDTARTDEVWIGLVELTARPDSELFGEDSGAITSVLASAHSFVDFANKVASFYDQLGIDVLEYSEVGRVSDHESRTGLSEELRALANEAEATGAVEADSYYVFPRDDDPGASILVEDRAGVDEVVEKVGRFIRGWLAGALVLSPAGLEIGDIGIAIKNREPEGDSFAVGYAASASELEQQADLFRAAARLAGERGEGTAT
jgi:hypothetical protein